MMLNKSNNLNVTGIAKEYEDEQQMHRCHFAFNLGQTGTWRTEQTLQSYKKKSILKHIQEFHYITPEI